MGLTFTRSTNFDANRIYQVEIAAGLRDVAEPHVGSADSRVHDGGPLCALISNLNVQGDLELGSTVTLSVDLNTPFAGSGLSDMDDAARVEYQIGTQRLMVSEVAPYSVSFPLILTDLNAESKFSVVATVYDQAQNSRTATYLFDTLVDLPPSVEFTYFARDDLPTSADEYRIGVKGYDDRCLQSLELALSGGVVLEKTTLSPRVPVQLLGETTHFTSMYQVMRRMARMYSCRWWQPIPRARLVKQ